MAKIGIEMLPSSSDSQCSIYPLCEYEDDLKGKRDFVKVRLQESKESLFIDGLLGSIKRKHPIDLDSARQATANATPQPESNPPSKVHNPKSLITTALQNWKAEREKVLNYQRGEKERQQKRRVTQMTKAKSQYKELKTREEIINKRILDSVSICQVDAVNAEEEGSEKLKADNKKKNETLKKDKMKASYKEWNLLHRPMALLNITETNESPGSIFAEVESAYANVMEGVRSSASLDKIENALQSMLNSRCKTPKSNQSNMNRISNPPTPVHKRGILKQKFETLDSIPELVDFHEEDADSLSDISTPSSATDGKSRNKLEPTKSDSNSSIDNFPSLLKNLYNEDGHNNSNPWTEFSKDQVGPVPQFLADFHDSDEESVTCEEMKQLFNYK